MNTPEHINNDTQSPRILVAGDDIIGTNLTKTYLEKAGVESKNIVVVHSTEEAISAAKNELFTAIITEIYPGVDGVNISQTIREHYLTANTPQHMPKVVAYTVETTAVDIPGAAELFDDIIIKPISRADFTARIRKVLNTPQGAN